MDLVNMEEALKQIGKNAVGALNELRSREGFALDPKFNLLNPGTSDQLWECTYTVSYTDDRRFKGTGVAKTKGEASKKSAVSVLCSMNIDINDLNRKKRKLDALQPSEATETHQNAEMNSVTFIQAQASDAHKSETIVSKMETKALCTAGISSTTVTTSKVNRENSKKELHEAVATITSSSSSSSHHQQHDVKLELDLENAAKQCRKSCLACLNEWCVQRGTSTNSTESAVSTPPQSRQHRVTLSVLVNDVIYEGSAEASRKQDAKQKAAVKLLLALGVTPEDIMRPKPKKVQVSSNASEVPESSIDSLSPRPSSTTVCSTKGAEEMEVEGPSTAKRDEVSTNQDIGKHVEVAVTTVAPANSIAELTKICGEKGVMSPIFKLIKQSGLDYHMECRITNAPDDLVTVGKDTKSIQAKRKAALQMIDELRKVQDNSGKIIKEVLRDYSSKSTSVNECKHPDCLNLISHRLHQFNNFSTSSFDLLREYDLSKRIVAVKTLKKIAKNEKFEIANLDSHLPNPDDKDEFFWQSCCYFTYTIKKDDSVFPSGFIGTAENLECARLNAAAKALEFLKEVTGCDD